MMLAEQACCNLVKQPQDADKHCAVPNDELFGAILCVVRFLVQESPPFPWGPVYGEFDDAA
jgi:hypothetical protein